ncbi:MAG TPA: MFS transporter [Candidatus Pygmaiobacter gallistercoris]|nr:MFS transporter [Candidatus Pygmaiobacter gallistercoris]
MTAPRRRPHYAFAVLAACLLLKLGLGGAVLCLTGNFVAPVTAALHCPVSRFTLLVSVEAAAMAALYTPAAKLLRRGPIGRIMGAAALAEVAGIALMATYRSPWLFSLSGAVIGAGMAFTGFVAVPLLVDLWFARAAGFALGLILAAEGISAVFFNWLTARLIVGLGWRAAYLVMALICLVVSVPGLFLIVKSPAAAGCAPYGAGESPAARPAAPVRGFTRAAALRSPVFWTAWAACMMYSVGYSVQQYLASFATMELGRSIEQGALAAALVSIGCVVSSALLGLLNDRLGARAGLLLGAVCALAGYGMLIGSIGGADLLLPGALLVGLGGSMYTVQAPLLTRAALGGRDYAAIWSLMMTGNSLIGAFSFSPVGLFYDLGGSYRGAFWMAICLAVGALLLGSFAVARGSEPNGS